MKKIIIICILGILFPTIGFSKPNTMRLVLVDEWFDSYGNIDWEDEKARLVYFATFV